MGKAGTEHLGALSDLPDSWNSDENRFGAWLVPFLGACLPLPIPKPLSGIPLKRSCEHDASLLRSLNGFA